MDNYILPSTSYEVPCRLARKHTLNTIIEDKRGEREQDYHEREDYDASRLGIADYVSLRSVGSTSPVPSLTSSVSSYYYSQRSGDFDSVYEVSDDDSEISPAIMTASASVRSVSPNQSPPTEDKAKRYPSLVIPSPSFWPSVPNTQTVQISPPRPPKIPLSPAVLSMLGHDLPRPNDPPSLAGNLNTDPHTALSGAVTPEPRSHSSDDEVRGHDGMRSGAGVSEQGVGYHKQSQRPTIRICTQGGSMESHESNLRSNDRVSVYDYATRDFSDSPVLGSEDESMEMGVELPFEALVTLQHLSLDTSAPRDLDLNGRNETEMQETHFPPRQFSADLPPASSTSEYSISQIDIPSPGGFFASLGSNARHTWHLGSIPPSAIPPSSTTAEQFYNCPWNRDLAPPVEHILEVNSQGVDTDGPPTARQVPLTAESTQTAFYIPNNPEPVYSSPIVDQDDDYEQIIQETAEKSLDRTSAWLAQQTSYLSALRETNPVNDISAKAEQELKRSSSHVRNDSLGSPIRKAVRFLESEAAKHEYCHPKEEDPEDHLYLDAFKHIITNTKKSDAFRHRLTRSDSIQSVRLCLPHEHLQSLQGRYHLTQIERPNPQRPISTMPGKETNGEDISTEQKVIARVETERQALDQVNARAWVVEASKYLAGGSLLSSPARCMTVKTPKLGDIQNGRVRNPGRVLDLGGLPNGDWAWHCAREFPHARIYTATTDSHLVDSCIQGPRNHRQAAVANLWTLPYPDNYFHAISARSLYAFLKTEKPAGEEIDEYELCLRECLRCLKPGGYLEFSLQDSEIVNAGSRGSAVSVEFGFNLKTRGYDPTPTKGWLARVKRAGFNDIKRAWTFMPMGSHTKEIPQVPETPPPNVSTFENERARVEAVHGPVGSTTDAATLSGLVGSWAWEQWMLRLQMEMGKDTLLEGVGAVLEEGKRTGAGWRCLSGWARKPLEMGA